jgi:aryl-alcohol dehydrogenase-like predicted oxidoreductase
MVVSSLSFGASSLGGVFHEINEQEAINTVHAAVYSGINFIDVSPYYGFTKAEVVLGKALKEIPRDNYFLSTKVGRFGTNGIKSWDYSAARAIQSVDESLLRLNIDFIDLINVHDMEFSDLNQVIHETIPALNRLKEQGKVGHVGITGLPLENFRYVIDRVPAGSVETILSFCHYCLNDDALVDYLDYFEQHNIGVINASPLSMGLLTRRGAPDWHPASAEILTQCRKAADYCNLQHYPIEQLAIRYSVSNPKIATTLVSSASPMNILENVRWAGESQNESLLADVLEILKPIHRQTWDNS